MSTIKTWTKPTKIKPRASALKKPQSQLNHEKHKDKGGSGFETPSANTFSLRDFQTRLRADIRFPVDACVIGEPVTITKILDPDLPRVGLLARCQRGERTYDVNLADVVFAPSSPGAALTARYREWLGFPNMSCSSNNSRTESTRPHKVASEDIVIGEPVELVVRALARSATHRKLGLRRR